MQTYGIASMAGPARGVCAWFAVLALFLAPVIINLTHSPAAAMAADMEVWHGHSHGDTADDSFAGHSTTDHEHQVTGLLTNPDSPQISVDDALEVSAVAVPSGNIRDRPRRPPRLI